MKTTHYRLFTRIMTIALASATAAQAAKVPRYFSYQGQITGATSPVDLVVKFYDASGTVPGVPGTELFEECHDNVVLDAGLFTIVVGDGVDCTAGTSTGGIPDTAIDANEVWLEVTVNGVVQPRIQLLAAVFSLKAISAEQLVRPDTLTAAVTIDATGDVVIPGEVGIGLPTGTTPNHPLHILNSTKQIAVDVETSYDPGTAIFGLATAPSVNATHGVWGESSSPRGRGVRGRATSTTGSGGGVFNFGGFFQASGYAGRGVYGEADNTDGGQSYGGFFVSQGIEGIGVFGDAANTAGAQTYGGYFISRSQQGAGLFAQGIQYGVHGRSPTGGKAGYFYTEDTALTEPTVVRFEANEMGGGVFNTHFAMDFTGRSINAYNLENSTDYSLSLNDRSSGDVILARGGGNVGVGGAAVGKLHVTSTDIGNPTGFTASFERDLIIEDDLAWMTLYSDDVGNVGSGISFVETGQSNNKWAIYRRTSGNVGDLNFTYGNDSNPTANEKMMQIFPDGTTRVQIIEITGGNDLAECFPASERAEPGMVMEIDPDQAGKLRVARGAYNRRVAGVVSGAGDLSVGAVLGDRSSAEGGPPIALSGRVWVYCDATETPIQPGDLLTTAELPGHAQAARDPMRASGATLGKAMTRLAEGRGLVLVLVTLQ